LCAPKSTHGGCFWKPIFKALAQLIPALIKIAVVTLATFACGTCAILISGVVSSVVVAVTGGNPSQALRAGFIAMATVAAFNFVGNVTGHQPDFGTPEYAANVAGHAAVGCVSAAASGGKCGAGALSAAVGAAGAPLIRDSGLGLIGGTAASAALGGLGSVAGGGKFADGAVTAAFGYLFNQMAGQGHNGGPPLEGDAIPEVKTPSPFTLGWAAVACTLLCPSGTQDISSETGWNNADTLRDHFERHGSDVNAKNPFDYAMKARAFFEEASTNARFDIKIDARDGTIRIYDSVNNLFGSFTSNGLTRTLFSPKSPDYWAKQPGTLFNPLKALP